jgi:hypothetical protein
MTVLRQTRVGAKSSAVGWLEFCQDPLAEPAAGGRIRPSCRLDVARLSSYGGSPKASSNPSTTNSPAVLPC